MKRPIRDESTPEGRKIWANVEKAASRVPDWLKGKVERTMSAKVKTVAWMMTTPTHSYTFAEKDSPAIGRMIKSGGYTADALIRRADVVAWLRERAKRIPDQTIAGMAQRDALGWAADALEAGG